MQINQDPKRGAFRQLASPTKWAGAVPGSEVDASEKLSNQFKTKDEDSDEPPKTRRKVKKEKVVKKKR